MEKLNAVVVLKDITLLLNAFGVANCTILAILFFRVRSHTNRYRNKLISALLLVLGFTILNTVINHSGYYDVLPYYETLSNALAYAIAPLLYLIVTLNKEQGTNFTWSHFALLGLILGSQALLMFVPQDFLIHAIFDALVLGPVHKIVWNLHFFIYLYLTFKALPSSTLKRGLTLQQVLFWGISIIWGVNLLILLFGNLIQPLNSLVRLNITLLFFCLTVVIFYKRMSPFDLVTTMKKSKYKIEPHTYEFIFQEIEGKELYLNPNLNIRNLSEHIGIPYSEISRIINGVSGTNFNNFINKMRVTHVVKQIRTNAHNNYTIMGLARKSGFRSASSFYSAFKKEMGTTPSEFIKNL